MADLRSRAEIAVELTAIVARIKIPAACLAAFRPGDRMEIEARNGLAPAVTLKLNGKQIASAALARSGDLLVARLTAMEPETHRVVFDRWLIRKQKTDET
jgi:flagellar motor switch/type III secretory pathway protein FliN